MSLQFNLARLGLGSAMVLLAIVIFGSARAQNATSPEAFLHQLYQPYVLDAWPDKSMGPQKIYDPDLLALIKRDQFFMQKYEKGLVRVDPICGCQDTDAFRVTKIAVQSQGAGKAKATVAFTNSGHRDEVGYELVSVGGQWRVHDILGSIAPSLRTYLATGLAKEEREIARSTQ